MGGNKTQDALQTHLSAEQAPRIIGVLVPRCSRVPLPAGMHTPRASPRGDGIG